MRKYPIPLSGAKRKFINVKKCSNNTSEISILDAQDPCFSSEPLFGLFYVFFFTELEAAATKIQATFRGHRVRKDDVVQKEEEQLNDRMGKLQTEVGHQSPRRLLHWKLITEK